MDKLYRQSLYRAQLLSQGDLEIFAQYVFPLIVLAQSEGLDKEIILQAIYEAMEQADGDIVKYWQYIKPLLLLLGVDGQGRKVIYFS